MLIARAPVRISLAGGGTDLAAYYSRHGGMVVSAAIDKHFYVFVNVIEGRDIQISSSDYHTFYRHNCRESLFWEGELSLPRAILHEFGFTQGLSLFLASEVPPGTGLGSSSAVAVAITTALATLRELPLSKQELAETACRIEIEKLGMPIGKQDQYACSYGGLNAFFFQKDGAVVRESLEIEPEKMRALEERLMLFFTGSAHNSTTILREQKQSSQIDDGSTVASLHSIKAIAVEVRRLLAAGQLDQFGALLHESWIEKRRLATGISNAEIDRWYQMARVKGAAGGKLTGAGGGGFLMFYCNPDRQAAVTDALESEGLRRMDFRFESGGARILMHTAHSLPLDCINGCEKELRRNKS
ncbi:MAG: GHMP kinase [Chloroflexi bacterium]|nr:GHMP kinase [Chloroflexota bacterium]